MYKPKRLSFWALILLAAALCGSGGSAFAQNPRPNGNGNGNANGKGNPAQQRRDAALQELDAAVAARIQVDPQFKKYVDAVKDHDNNVKDFVKQKKQTGGGK